MNLSVFYSEKQHVSDPQPGSPSPGKPDQVMASWRERGFPIKIHPPQAATVEDLCLAHDADYVRGVLDCSRANGFGTRSAAVAASLPWTVGSLASAALHALQSGTGKSAVAVSPTSGFHHAGYAFGGGFCTFNGLIVAARKALQAGAGRVGILDLDQHYGNGTADIDDLLCLLAGFANFADCSAGDIFPCGGNGIIDIDDVVGGLIAFTGTSNCAGVPPCS